MSRKDTPRAVDVAGRFGTRRRPRRRGLTVAAEVLAVALLASGSVAYASSSDRPNSGRVETQGIDTDGDGLMDEFEQTGWLTQTGVLHVTDPISADSDGDGLSDREEAGDVVLCTIAGYVYSGFSDPRRRDTDDDGLSDADEADLNLDPWDDDSDDDQLADGREVHTLLTSANEPDTDGDGLRDGVEVNGWTTRSGAAFITDPTLDDTDRDGLSDSVESGVIVISEISGDVYAGYSNPRAADSDDDGLNDLDEADLSTAPLSADTDGDTLADGHEVFSIGTAPDEADTDGDGFDDAFEVTNAEDRGLDPLRPDIRVSRLAYATEFARGAVLGDIAPGDSIAWLAGNLTTGVTPGLGTITDIRDAVGAAIHADWVSAGISAVGAMPAVGDAVAVPIKIGKFIARHPELGVAAAALVVGMKGVPERVKFEATNLIWKGDDLLRHSGMSDETLQRFQQGKVNLDNLADSVKGSSYFDAPRTGFISSPPNKRGSGSEEFFQNLLNAHKKGENYQVPLRTVGCVDVCNLTNVRKADVYVNKTLHEVKEGYQDLTPHIGKQVESDAWLLENSEDVEAVRWHFTASAASSSIGPSPALRALLEEKGIPYTIHQP